MPATRTRDDGQLALDAYKVAMSLSQMTCDFRDETVMATQHFPLLPRDITGMRRRLSLLQGQVAQAEQIVAQLEANQQ